MPKPVNAHANGNQCSRCSEVSNELDGKGRCAVCQYELDRHNQNQKKYAANLSPEKKAARREYCRLWFVRNREHRSEYRKQWRRDNPTYDAEWRAKKRRKQNASM